MISKVLAILFFLSVFSMQIFGAGASDWAGALQGIATTFQGVQQAQKDKQAADQKQQQLDQELGKVTGQENFATGQGQSQGIYTNPVQNLGTPNQGYPVLDPYKNPGYWQQRGHQFQFNMSMAAKRAELTDQKAAEALAAERQMTNSMLGAVGGLLQTAGGQMEKIGAERAKAAETERTQQTANFRNACAGASDCQRVEKTDEDGNVTYEWSYTDGDGNSQTMSESDLGGAQDMIDAQQQAGQRTETNTYLLGKGITERGGVYYDADGNMLGTDANAIASDLREKDAQAEAAQQAEQQAAQEAAARQLQEDKEYANQRIDLTPGLTDIRKLELKREVSRAESVEALQEILGSLQTPAGGDLTDQNNGD